MPEPTDGFMVRNPQICSLCGEPPWHETKDCLQCPACGSMMTATLSSEDSARCLACLSFWAPSTRLRKATPQKRYLGLSPDPAVPPSVTDDL